MKKLSKKKLYVNRIKPTKRLPAEIGAIIILKLGVMVISVGVVEKLSHPD